MKRRAVPGVYSLATEYPDVAAEWHPTRNDRTADGVTPASSSKAWWTCAQGHEWEAVVSNRSKGGAGCPYCKGRRVLTGVNDLATLYPELAAQWHPTRNVDEPTTTFANSHSPVWWLCSGGHEWRASPNVRVNRPACAYCSGRRPWPGETDLGTINPAAAAEWHPTKNGEATPAQVNPFSHRKAWWLCPKGHEWEASVKNRHYGAGCPMCGHWTAVPGETDLATLWPDVAAQWHPARNGELRPDQILPASARKVWWECAKGHEWETAISNRTNNGTGCPYCSGRLVIPGETDIRTVNPGLAEQWHPTRNGDLTPDQVTASSGRRVWWECAFGHEWQASVALRSIGTGCSYCSGNKVLPGFNDLATKYPDVAMEWHPTRNGDLRPDQVLAGAKRKAWWLCTLDGSHEWHAAVSNRTGRGSGCPRCAAHGFDVSKEAWLYFLEHDGLGLYQIGISNELDVRLRFHASSGWTLRDVEGAMPGDLARNWERDMLAALARRGGVPPLAAGLDRFNGHTEAWTRESCPVESLAELRAMVQTDDK
jgi:hypothetical protein